MSANRAEPSVKFIQGDGYVVWDNSQGRFWIGTSSTCVAHADSVSDWKLADTDVGPGYISKLARKEKNGATEVLARPRNARATYPDGKAYLLQGVGVFGAHLAVQNTTTGMTRFGVANGNYCLENAPDILPGLAGVKRAQLIDGPKKDKNGVGILTMDVWIGDSDADLLKVRYDYRVYKNVVDQWTTVTSLCGNGSCVGGKRYYVKEPKLVVDLNADNNPRRVACYNASGGVTGAPSTGSNATHQTAMCGDPNRVRAMWDADECRSATPNNCLNVVGRSAETPTPLGRLHSWEGSHLGFDKWALDANAHVGQLIDPSPETCQFTQSSDSRNRRWELYGKDGGSFKERGVVFKAWEGGVGPNNCIGLFSPLPSSGTSYTVFNAYSFGGGWGNISKGGPPQP